MAAESEPNNTKLDADELPLVESISANLVSEEDEDFFRFTSAAGGVLSLAVDLPTDDIWVDYFTFTLLDEADNVLARYQSGQDAAYSIGVAVAGTYYLRVAAGSDGYNTFHDPGQYSLSASFAAGSTASVETEINDSIVTADSLTPGVELSGQVAGTEDNDFYSFDVTGPSLMSVVVDLPAAVDGLGSYIYTLGLFDHAGETLGLYELDRDETFSFAVTSAGSYYLRMGPRSDQYYTYYESDPYALTLDLSATSLDSFETEANDSSATADPITPGVVTGGQLASVDDLDYFQVTLAGPAILSVALDLPDIPYTYYDYFSLAVLDADDNLIGQYESSEDGSFRFGIADSGTYYLRMADATSPYGTYYDSGQYNLLASLSSDPVGSFESEFNDSSESANPLILASIMGGQLSSDTDLDYFGFEVAEAGTVTVNLDLPPNDFMANYFTVALVDESENVIGQYYPVEDEALTFGVADAGSYFLKLSPYDDGYSVYRDSGEYQFVTSFTPGGIGDFESEPNDSVVTADQLTLGDPIGAQLATADDLDYFALVAEEPGVLSVDMDVPSNYSYGQNFFTLSMLDTSGTVLGEYATGQDNSVSFGVEAAGNYFLRMASWSDQYTTYHDAGQYNLLATLAASGPGSFESENNDSLGSADSLVLDSSVRGQLASPLDQDFFHLAVADPGALSVQLDVPTDSDYADYFTLALLNAAGTVLGQYRTGKDISVDFGLAGAGDYYLRITDASGEYVTYHDSGQYALTASFSAGSGSGFESEDNNTLETADETQPGTGIRGQLASIEDQDYFRLADVESGVLSIAFDSPLDSSYSDYFNISLYNADGELLSRQSTGVDLTYQVGLPVSGTYFAAVSSDQWVYESGQYGVTFSVTPGGAQNFEQEPNDEVPNYLAPGSSLTGQVATTEDIDWYYFDADSPAGLTVSLDVPTDDPFVDFFKVQVLDETGNLLAGRATGEDFEFGVSLLAAGRYLVGVGSSGYYHDSGNYQLALTLDDSPQAQESESNDSLAEANPIVTGSPVRGQLSSDSDRDYFSVAAIESGVLTVNFDSPVSSSSYDYFRIAVYDSEGSLLGFRDTGYDLGFEVEVEEAGDYYVAVSAFSFLFDDQDYYLTVDVLIDDPVPDGALVGTGANDSLTGTEQDDLIYGLGGNDLIDGAGGVDTAAFRTGRDRLTINTVEGLTAVRGNFAAGEHAYTVTRIWNVEKIRTQSGIEELGVQAASPLLGTTQADILVGTAGDDLLDGLGGNDFVDGGAGDDLLALFGAESQFSVITVGGITRIQASESANEYAGFTVKTVNVERLGFNQGRTRLLETNDTNKLIGSTSDELLLGSNADDIIDGAGGNDTIDGGAGLDTVVLFGKTADFQISYPGSESGELRITGEAGAFYSGRTLVATHVEAIAFTDGIVSVTNPPRAVLTPARTLLSEGDQPVSLEVSLSVAPQSTVNVLLDGGEQLELDISQLEFDAGNWAIPQLVEVSAIDDEAFEKQHSGLLEVSISSGDPLYSDVVDSSLNFLISDNDAGSFGSVSGRIWNDVNKNGIFDGGENGFAGWVVFDDTNSNGQLDGDEISTYSDVAGFYRLEGLEPGSHLIGTQSRKGWVPTFPDNTGAGAVIIDNRSTSDDVILDTFYTQYTQSPAAELAIGSYENLGTATNIAAFHNDPRFDDIDGQGYSVVVIDSGIDLNHPFFGPDSNGDGIADRILYQHDFYAVDDSDASDGFGHGTHVAGIIGSSDALYPGIAPQVNLIILKIFSDTGRGDNGHALKEAATWVAQHVDDYNIAAVNLSVGFGNFHSSPYSGFLSTDFASLANQGVVVVASSGNEYDDYPGTLGVSYPSSDPWALSVGAVWAADGIVPGVQEGVTDAIAFFSQRDELLSDVFAPGVAIYSAQLGGNAIAYSGTSMAAPEITGMVVLAQQLAERELGRRLTFQEIQTLFRETGEPIIDGDDENDIVPNTGLTFYRADMLALAEAILELKPPASYGVEVVAGGTVSDRDFGFSAATFTQGLDSDELIFGSSSGEIIRGGGGADQIRGGLGSDELYGEAGDDFLVGEEGDDYVDGGSDNDLIIAGSGAGDDTYQGGEGIDTVAYSSALAAIEVDLGAGLANSLDGENSAGTGIDSLDGIENVVGSDFGDLLSGDERDNQIAGGAGNDTLSGGPGNDTLLGESGVDTVSYGEQLINYSILRDADSFQISDLGGGTADQVSGVERLAFSDVSRAYDLDGNAGMTIKLLGAMLGTEGAEDRVLRGIGIDIFDNAGLSFEQVMDIALDVVLPSNRSNEAVVNLLWANLVGGPTPQDLLNDLVAALDSGAFTQAALAVVAAEHPANLDNIGLVGLTESGLDYFPLA